MLEKNLQTKENFTGLICDHLAVISEISQCFYTEYQNGRSTSFYIVATVLPWFFESFSI